MAFLLEYWTEQPSASCLKRQCTLIRQEYDENQKFDSIITINFSFLNLRDGEVMQKKLQWIHQELYIVY
jgi:hypothetical protein